MKRSYVSLFYLALTLMIFGCTNSSDNHSETPTDWKVSSYEDVNDFAGVTMTVNAESVSPTGLTVVFENSSESQAIYGDFFELEKKIDKNWYQVPVAIDDYGFNDIGYELNPSETEELTVDWEWLYEKIDSGEYRIIKDVLDFRKTGDFDKYYLAAPFTIE